MKMKKDIFYYKNGTDYYKVEMLRNKITCISFSKEGNYEVTYPAYDSMQLIKTYKAIDFSEYLNIVHLFFNSKQFSWVYDGISYTTTELDENAFYRAIRTNSEALSVVDKTIFFYNGSLYYASHSMACGGSRFELVNIHNNYKTITSTKYIKSITIKQNE